MGPPLQIPHFIKKVLKVFININFNFVQKNFNRKNFKYFNKIYIERRKMPRLSRKYYTSSFLHIMVQGINKEEIFRTDFYKYLYIKFINTMQENLDIDVLAYTVMNNHTHILLHYDKIDDVSKFIGKINQKFAQVYNKSENRVGYVFRGRYKCEQITDREYLYNVLPYIHFNPYKAGIVDKLLDYKFSTYPSYLNEKMDREKGFILFNTYNYKDLFVELHKEYFNKILNKKITYEDIISDYIKRNKINTMELILKDKKLLLDLILEIQSKTRLTNKEISEFLGIGKNRITNLKKQISDK